MQIIETVILDCYTDEPSGYGVRPYLGTHQIHLSQALTYLGIDHYYLTIDDLRFATRGVSGDENNSDISTLNTTNNCANALEIIQKAKLIYIIMGCFVDYKYFSTIPPKSDEVFEFLKLSKSRKILFYVLGTVDGISPDYQNSKLQTIIDHVELGNTYRYVIENNKHGDIFPPNYDLLEKISSSEPQIIQQLKYPIIAEIETGAGCNTPFCSFCIESVRAIPPSYRTPESIILQIKTLYRTGVRYFRLGRQPNFFQYQNQDVSQVHRLLAEIREGCPNLSMLHIDNANIVSVISKNGIEIIKEIVRYCTPGNIAPLGIESFDDNVRTTIRKTGTAEQAYKAISIISEIGSERGGDCLPKLLPGINLIYGLPGQTFSTHQTNLEYLAKILNNGLFTARLFFRKMTRPTGISFNDGPTSNDEYLKWFNDIVDLFVLPMQSRVYTIGKIIKNNREVVLNDGNSYLRTLGTCPIRIKVIGNKLTPYNFYDVQITKNLDYRLLQGIVKN